MVLEIIRNVKKSIIIKNFKAFIVNLLGIAKTFLEYLNLIFV